jgi:Acetyltransferase (GNAT) family
VVRAYVAALGRLAMERFRIRPATKVDAGLLSEWRNDESTRKMSRTKDLVEWDGIPAATFRIDGEEISYTVASDHRNRGIAKLMLKEVSSRFGRLCAHGYADNEPSIRVARSVGLDVVIIDG